MAKIGVNIKIDVTKMDKTKFFKGDKGTYAELTTFIDLDNKGQFGDNGMVTQNWRDAVKGETPILGNATIFWRDDNQQQSQPQQSTQQAAPDFDDDEVPF